MSTIPTDADVTTGTTINGMKTPDVTVAQIIALVESVIAVVVAFGLDLSNSERTSLVALAGVLATILVGSDAYIRRGRAQAASASMAGQPAAGPPVLPDVAEAKPSVFRSGE